MVPQPGTRFKRCLVPGCFSNTSITPEKQFFSVPLEQATRIRWFAIVWPGLEFNARQLYYCCEDHFDLKQDLKYSIRGVPQGLKKDAVPSLLLDLIISKKRTSSDENDDVHNDKEQSDSIYVPPKKTWLRNSSKDNEVKPLYKLRRLDSKKQKNTSTDLKKVIHQNNIDLQLESVCINEETQADTKRSNDCKDTIQTKSVEECNESNSDRTQAVTSTSNNEIQMVDPPIKEEILDDLIINGDSGQQEIESYSNVESILSNTIVSPETKNKPSLSLQVNSPEIHLTSNTSSNASPSSSETIIKAKTKTKSIMVKPIMVDVACQYESQLENKACSPSQIVVQVSEPNARVLPSDSKHTLVFVKNKKNELYPVHKSDEDENENMDSDTNHLINNNPKEYIGIDIDNLPFINELKSSTGCSTRDIKLTLMKIKMNNSFRVLARDFKILKIQAITIFNKTVGLLASWLKRYIHTLTPAGIEKNIPNVFHESYDHVYAIIDALEVDIEKSLDPLQSSWSSVEPKEFCTLKYLINCTPDGFISFVSSGYGGDISDVSLFRDSKIVNTLPEGCAVMINGEFDAEVETVLSKKKCRLIQGLKSDSDGMSPTNDADVTRENNLRYVKETMKKIQEYEILRPNAGLDLRFLSHVDNIVTIVIGLVNYHKLNTIVL